MIGARKHNAVDFRPVITLRFIDCAFKRADVAGIFFLPQTSCVRAASSSRNNASITLSGSLSFRIFARRFWISREYFSNSSLFHGVGIGVRAKSYPSILETDAGLLRSPVRSSNSAQRADIWFPGLNRVRRSDCRKRLTCSTRRQVPQSDGQTRAQKHNWQRRCLPRPCCRD